MYAQFVFDKHYVCSNKCQQLIFVQCCIVRICFLHSGTLYIPSVYFICTQFSFCIACFLFDRHVANGEILGVSLLMEDVLQTGYQDISHLSDADDLETARSEKKEGSVAPSRGPSRLDIQTPTGSISSKAGINQ